MRNIVRVSMRITPKSRGKWVRRILLQPDDGRCRSENSFLRQEEIFYEENALHFTSRKKPQEGKKPLYLYSSSRYILGQLCAVSCLKIITSRGHAASHTIINDNKKNSNSRRPITFKAKKMYSLAEICDKALHLYGIKMSGTGPRG